jgi:hypothetical protein
MKGKESMAEKSPEKSLEMRVADLEDKLSKLHITEAEMKTYQKVASAMMQAGAARLCVVHCVVGCVVRCVVSCIFECTCGPCLQSGGGGGLGGFGGLGQ